MMVSSKSIATIRRTAKECLSDSHFERFLHEELLTALEVGELLDIPPPFRAVRRWRGDGHVLALPVARGFLYPAFQIDHERRRLDPLVVAFVKARRDHSAWTQLALWYERKFELSTSAGRTSIT
ncbi:MAG: hypothetical protein ABWY58_07655 [Aeromicrobium sp.]